MGSLKFMDKTNILNIGIYPFIACSDFMGVFHTDHHDLTELLWRVVLNTNDPNVYPFM